MISISISQFICIVGFFAGSCISLIIYIYNNLIKRINKIENTQTVCPVNKIYTILEILKTDITWIKKTINNKV